MTSSFKLRCRMWPIELNPVTLSDFSGSIACSISLWPQFEYPSSKSNHFSSETSTLYFCSSATSCSLNESTEEHLTGSNSNSFESELFERSLLMSAIALIPVTCNSFFLKMPVTPLIALLAIWIDGTRTLFLNASRSRVVMPRTDAGGNSVIVVWLSSRRERQRCRCSQLTTRWNALKVERVGGVRSTAVSTPLVTSHLIKRPTVVRPRTP